MPCAALIVLLLAHPPQTPACADAAACRTAALEAAARQDYEVFHDFAWRAAQRGKPNDPELMYLLARAQSLSGRPGDALVMLRRLAQLGVATDAAESNDFARVRALAGWSELVDFIATAARPSASVEPPASAAKTAVTPAPASTPAPDATKPPASDAPPPPKKTPPPAPPESRAAKTERPPTTPSPSRIEPAATADNAVALTSAPLDAVGLAYDSASRRFVVGDRIGNKVIVADEVFKRVNDLIGALSGGFGTLTAVEIDSRRGDLWLASSGEDGAASLHKLQLVSGRVLFSIDVPDALRPARLTDILVDDGGGLRVADARGARIFSVRPNARSFATPIALDLVAPASIAPAGDIAYVAHEGGLSIADLKTGRVTPLTAAVDVALTGIRRVRAIRGGLVAIAASTHGPSRLVRVRLTRDRRRVTAVEPMDPSASSQGSALAIGPDAAYYVAQTEAGTVIRRVALKR